MNKILISCIILIIMFTSCSKIKYVSKTNTYENSIETDTFTTYDTIEVSQKETLENTVETSIETTVTSKPIVTYNKQDYEKQELNFEDNIISVNFSVKPDFSEINNMINEYKNPCAIYVEDLNSGATFYYNKDKYFYGASLSKLPFMYNCCLEIEKGNYNLDDMVLYEEKYKHGGTGSLQHEEPGDYYSVQSLIEMVLYNSDNTAYNILCNYFGFNSINERFKNDGYISSISKENIFCMLSAQEMAHYWKMIYLNKDSSEAFKIVNHSTKTSKFSPIRIALNSKEWQTCVKSKTGWSKNNYHDTGIVLRGNPYIVIIMTKSGGEAEDEKFLYNIANEIDKVMIKYKKFEY